MEGRVIEYKRELTKDVEGLEKEVVSFLNTFGGELVFGLAKYQMISGLLTRITDGILSCKRNNSLT